MEETNEAVAYIGLMLEEGVISMSSSYNFKQLCLKADKVTKDDIKRYSDDTVKGAPPTSPNMVPTTC